MKSERATYAVANMMPSILYVPKYTALNIMPSKITAVEMPGIENHRTESYPRAEGMRLKDAGLLMANL